MTVRSDYRYCCEATRFRSALFQAAYLTNLGCLCPRPVAFEFSWMYLNVYITNLPRFPGPGIEALAFSIPCVVNRFRKKTHHFIVGNEKLIPKRTLDRQR